MKKLRFAFVTGFLIIVPVLATIDIMLWLVTAIDRNTRRYTINLFSDEINFFGLGLLVALGVILIVGALTQNFVGKWVVSQIDTLLRRFPFVGGLYGIIKKFMDTVFNPDNAKFNEVVLVEFPVKGVFSIGFRTGTPDAKLLEHFDEPMVNVFIPLVPNPTAGYYILVPQNQVRKLDMTVQQAFKVAVSMGVVTSDEAIEKTIQ